MEPPSAQPERAAEERVPADEPVVVPDRRGPPQLPDGGVFEELEPIVEPAPALPDPSAELEPPSLPEAASDQPVVSEEPEEPVDEEPVDDEPDEEAAGDDESSQGDEDEKKDKRDHPDHPDHPDPPDPPGVPAESDGGQP